jgi:hypothetical protein
MYKIYVVNNFNSNVNCIPPYINCERNCFRCVIAHSLTNANLFVDGDGGVPCIYYLCSRTPGFDDEKRY